MSQQGQNPEFDSWAGLSCRGVVPVFMSVANGVLLGERVDVGDDGLGPLAAEMMARVSGLRGGVAVQGELAEPGRLDLLLDAAEKAVQALCGERFSLALIGDRDLAVHVCDCSVGDDAPCVDYVREVMESRSTGQAILCEVPLAAINLADGWEFSHMVDKRKEKAYQRKDPRTAPPALLYEDGELADGYHRYRNANTKGRECVLAYVCVDPGWDLSALIQPVSYAAERARG